MNPADETPKPTIPVLGDWAPIGAPAVRDTTTPDRRISRMRARAEEKRADRHDAIQVRAEERADRRAAKQAARADRTARWTRYRAAAAALRRRILVTIPIIFPMAVAWTGQADFAMRILGWDFLAAIGFAAAWEMSTAFVAWMYHEARKSGDTGLKYRIATWIFAGGAALMNYWHAAGTNWAANPKAVSFATMSITGIALWELYASLVHRKQLREKGLVSAPRPTIGLVRWLRYPIRSWTAWSLIILDGHRTLDSAWTAADETIRARRETTDRRDHCAETTDTTKPRRIRPRRDPETNPETVAERSPHAPETVTRPMETRQETTAERAETAVVETSPADPTETKVPQVTAETETRKTPETSAVPIGDRGGDRDAEVELLVSLMETRGDAMKVSLDDAIRETGRPKSTAAKRLAAARDRYRRTSKTA